MADEEIQLSAEKAVRELDRLQARFNALKTKVNDVEQSVKSLGNAWDPAKEGAEETIGWIRSLIAEGRRLNSSELAQFGKVMSASMRNLDVATQNSMRTIITAIQTGSASLADFESLLAKGYPDLISGAAAGKDAVKALVTTMKTLAVDFGTDVIAANLTELAAKASELRGKLSGGFSGAVSNFTELANASQALGKNVGDEGLIKLFNGLATSGGDIDKCTAAIDRFNAAREAILPGLDTIDSKIYSVFAKTGLSSIFAFEKGVDAVTFKHMQDQLADVATKIKAVGPEAFELIEKFIGRNNSDSTFDVRDYAATGENDEMDERNALIRDLLSSTQRLVDIDQNHNQKLADQLELNKKNNTEAQRANELKKAEAQLRQKYSGGLTTDSTLSQSNIINKFGAALSKAPLNTKIPENLLEIITQIEDNTFQITKENEDWAKSLVEIIRREQEISRIQEKRIADAKAAATTKANKELAGIATDNFIKGMPIKGDIDQQYKYYEALKKVELELAKLGGESLDLIATYNKLEDGTLQVTKQNANLVKSLTNLRATMKGTTKDTKISLDTLIRFTEFRFISQAFYTLSGYMRQAITDAFDFATAVAEIQTVSQNVPMTFDAWAEGLQKVSTNYNLDLLDTAKGAYQALSNQIAEGPEALAFLDTAAEFSRATVSSLSASIDTLTSVLNSYGLSAGAATRISDELFTAIDLGRITAEQLGSSLGAVTVVSDQLGVSTAEAFASLSGLTIEGISTPTAITLLKNEMNKLIDPTEKMKELFDKWGVGSGQEAIASFGWPGVIQKLAIEADKGVEVLEELFSRIRAFQPALSQTAAFDKFIYNIRSVENAMGESGNAAEIVMSNHAQILEREITRAKNILISYANSWIELGATFQGVTSGMSPSGEKKDQFLSFNLGDIAGLVGKLTVLSGVLVGISGLVGGIAQAFGRSGSIFDGKTFLSEWGSTNINASKAALFGLADAIEVTGTGSVALNKSGTQLSTTFGAIKTGLKGLTQSFVSAGLGALPVIGAFWAMYEIIDTIKDVQLNNISEGVKAIDSKRLKELTLELGKFYKEFEKTNLLMVRGGLLRTAEQRSAINEQVASYTEAYGRLINAIKDGVEKSLDETNKNIEKSQAAVAKGISNYYDFLDAELDRRVKGRSVRGDKNKAKEYLEYAEQLADDAARAAGYGDKELALNLLDRQEAALNSASALNSRLNLEQKFVDIYNQRQELAKEELSNQKLSLFLTGEQHKAQQSGLKLDAQALVGNKLLVEELFKALDEPVKVIENSNSTTKDLEQAIKRANDIIDQAGIGDGMIAIFEDGERKYTEIRAFMAEYQAWLLKNKAIQEQTAAFENLQKILKDKRETIANNPKAIEQAAAATSQAYRDTIGVGKDINVLSEVKRARQYGFSSTEDKLALDRGFDLLGNADVATATKDNLQRLLSSGNKEGIEEFISRQEANIELLSKERENVFGEKYTVGETALGGAGFALYKDKVGDQLSAIRLSLDGNDGIKARVDELKDARAFIAEYDRQIALPENQAANRELAFNANIFNAGMDGSVFNDPNYAAIDKATGAMRQSVKIPMSPDMQEQYDLAQKYRNKEDDPLTKYDETLGLTEEGNKLLAQLQRDQRDRLKAVEDQALNAAMDKVLGLADALGGGKPLDSIGNQVSPTAAYTNAPASMVSNVTNNITVNAQPQTQNAAINTYGIVQGIKQQTVAANNGFLKPAFGQ